MKRIHPNAFIATSKTVVVPTWIPAVVRQKASLLGNSILGLIKRAIVYIGSHFRCPVCLLNQDYTRTPGLVMGNMPESLGPGNGRVTLQPGKGFALA